MRRNLNDSLLGKRQTKPAVTLISGDGIGPEVVGATCRVIAAAGVEIDWHEADAGKKVFERGIASGVPKETMESLASTKLALKGPLETPVGHGGKSANVTLRKLFEAFANIRPVRELPGIETPFSGRGIDLVVVRENVEDLYAGIEHGQTADVSQCLKLISNKGCEKIARFGFELAKAEGRKSIHVATKANIMKLTEGRFKRVFEAVAMAYPEIHSRHILIDNCAHQLVIRPEQFDVIVTTNMNGDILSDLTSGLVGGLGIAPSANIGHDSAFFEAVHGSAPDIAGRDMANPMALMLSGVMMLRHLGEFEAAQKIEDALIYTLESGQGLPGDVAKGKVPVLGTRAFTDLVIENFGQIPVHRFERNYEPMAVPKQATTVAVLKPDTRAVVGADVFIEFDGLPAVLGDLLNKAATGSAFRLKMISNRGTQVYPPTGASPDCVDHWRCRFMLQTPVDDIDPAALGLLLASIDGGGLRWMHLEKLNVFDGEEAFSKAQGEN